MRISFVQSFSKERMDDADGQFMLWYAPEDKWVKIESAGKELRFYQSEDKKEWKEVGSFGDGYIGKAHFAIGDLHFQTVIICNGFVSFLNKSFF